MDTRNRFDILCAIQEAENHKLMTEYIPVEYIESNGTQWIDTGILLGSNDFSYTIETTIAFANTGTRQAMGFDRGNGYGSFGISSEGIYQIGTSNSLTSCVYGTAANLVYKSDLDTRPSWVQLLRGETKMKEVFSIPLRNSLILFATGTNTSSANMSAKMYSLKIYISGSLYASYVPCYRKSDMKPGLFDSLTNTFLVNNGSGDDFSVGPDAIELPSAYQRVDYLESSGEQYIDSLVASGTSFGFSMSMMPLENLNDASYFSASSTSPELIKTSDYVLLGKNNSTEIDLAGTVSQKTLIEYKDGKIYSDGVEKGTLGASSISSETYFIFNSHDDPDTYSSMRLYYLVMSENSGLTRYFIPCYRISDFKPGFYDYIERKFFTNDGTSEFVCGSLPVGFKKLTYIQTDTTNKQYINCNYLETDLIGVDCKFETTATSFDNYLFGAYQKSSMLYNGIYGGSVIEYNWLTVSYPSFGNSIEMTQVISGTTNTITINGTSYQKDTGTSNYTNYCIFACNNGGRRPGVSVKCYYFKIKDNNVLMRDFVPALCYAGNPYIDGNTGNSVTPETDKPGLYDYISGKFFVNQSSGEFSYA